MMLLRFDFSLNEKSGLFLMTNYGFAYFKLSSAIHMIYLEWMNNKSDIRLRERDKYFKA